jgi:RNA methyltransferase, TrmH family
VPADSDVPGRRRLISSTANPRVKQLLGLRRRRERDETGLTLVDGTEELSLALDAGVRPAEVFVCTELLTGEGPAVVSRASDLGAEIVHLSTGVFTRVAYREGPDGLLATVPAPRRHLRDLTIPTEPLLLVCQGIEKPGNLGAMLRTADAAGLDGVVATDPVTDVGNPNVIRASKGTVFAVPVATATTSETLTWLQGRDIRLVVTTPDTDRDYTDCDYSGGVAVAVGAEKDGVSEDALRAASDRVRIPMLGKANSLNVAAAAAIVLYEAVRQRTPRQAR